MYLYEILKRKGSNVFQVSLEASLADVVDRLVEYRVGSLLVSDGKRVVGIITERDILKASAANDHHLAHLKVQDYMTKDLILGHPSDDISTAMGKMTDHRVRHLPVFDQEQLCGMISIGDIVKAQFEMMAVENHYLKSYIQS
jgi:CBS domain-containing protein